MDKNTINDINELIQEKLDKIYNSALLLANLSLLNHYKNNPKDWKKKQIKDLPKLTNQVNKIIKEEVKNVYKSIELAVLLAYKVADNTFKDLDVNQKKIKLNASEDAKESIKRFKIMTNSNLNKLPYSIRNYQLGNINKIYNEVSNKKIDDMYEEISSKIDKGLENVPKVTYDVHDKEGNVVGHRQVSYQAYMDMKMRTEIQKEAREFQIANARENGLIFYLCSSLSDSAPDHAPYQGKIYVDKYWSNFVDEETAEKVELYIRANDILTMQDIEENAPYLNSRPNCRHHFEAISTEEVLGTSVSKMLKDHDMIKGSYDKQNYIDLQEQRKNERDIREIKSEIAGKEIEYDNAPKDRKPIIEQEIKNKERQIREIQKEQRDLINENPNLERNYTRESLKYLENDLGRTIEVSFKSK